MASVLQICNMALSHALVGKPIQSIDERLREAELCKLHYEPTRDAVLEAHDWVFASRRITLAALADPPDDWAYRYAWPHNALVVREIVNTASNAEDARIPFTVEDNGDGTGLVILTDQRDAVARCTVRVAATGLFSATFVQALALALGSKLALNLSANPSLSTTLYQFYERLLAQARALNAHAKHVARPTGKFVAGRTV